MRKMWTSKLRLFCSYASLLVWHNTVGYSFPANIRHGYNSCQTCHVAPSGGGVVSKYGKMTSEAFMSSFSYENQSRPLWGLYDLPAWVDVGGDVRYVSLLRESGGQSQELNFAMQTDFELALHLSDKFSFVTSGGTYGQQEVWQRRRYYALLKTPYNSKLRVGRFYPAYGILLDDHTKLHRRGLGFDQGGEKYNVELSFGGKNGELFLTRILGADSYALAKRDGSIELKTSDEEGSALRGTRFVSKHFQLGLSFLQTNSLIGKKQAIGAHAMWGQSKRLYHFLELNNLKLSTSKDDTSFVFYRLGYVLFKGLHVKGEYQMQAQGDRETNIYGAALQWFPMPHLELLYQYDFLQADSFDAVSNLFMLHYYF